MTATRERQSAPSPVTGAPEWSERSIFGRRGVPLWAGILLAAAPTALGTLLDVLIWSMPGLLFTVLFFAGSVLAVALVQREKIFGPMVQSPLIVSLVMPLMVLASGSGAKNGGASSKVFSVANPLINSFPAMATTTAAALLLGLLRIFALERAPATPDDEFTTELQRMPQDTERGKPATTARRGPSEAEAKQATKQGQAGPSKRSRDERGRGQPPERGTAKRPAADRKRPEPGPTGAKRPAAERKRPASGEGIPGNKPAGSGRGPTPGRPRGGEARPDGSRGQPPGRGSGPRPAPGRGRPQEPRPGSQPPRRPQQRPRRDEF